LSAAPAPETPTEVKTPSATAAAGPMNGFMPDFSPDDDQAG
jgi:hypothetical protein